MTTVVAIFVVLASTALIVQAAILTAMFLRMRSAAERVERVATDVEARLIPTLVRIQILVEDCEPRIVAAVSDAAEVTHLARGQAQKMDRILSEVLDRVRLQLAHVDQILTGALEAVEDAGASVRRSVVGPVRTATAVIRGVQTGLEFLRSRRRHRSDGIPSAASDMQDENLFI